MRALPAILALIIGSNAEAAPRAASLDYCADQYLIALADEADIAGVSPVADDEFSHLRDKAQRLPKLRPTAEEIAIEQPDIVLRFWGGAPRLTEFLERAGVRVVTLAYAVDFDGVRDNIRMAAAALEQEARGEALVDDLDARLDRLAKRPVHPYPAYYVTPGGVTAGSGTMIDAILSAARVRNATAETGLSYWPPLPAEALVMNPPRLLVAGFFESDGERVNHWSAARHPAFKAVFDEAAVIHLPADILSCPAWFSVDAAERIGAAIDTLEENYGGD